MSSVVDVIISVMRGEKASINESIFRYTFWVHDFATKDQIKKALQLIYGEIVTSVNVIRRKAKVNLRKRQSHVQLTSRPSKQKIAIVSFGGKKIDISTNEFV